MRLEVIGRDAGRARLHAEPEVLTIAGTCRRFPDDEVLKLLHKALYGPKRPLNPEGIRGLVRLYAIPDEIYGDAYALTKAALSIALAPDPRRGDLRGAVVEAVTEAIIGLRTAVEAEVAIEMEPGRSTPPFDLVVDGDPLELYQCKSHPQWLDPPGAAHLEGARHAADVEHRKCRVAIATLRTRNELANALRGLPLMIVIYSAAREDLAALAIEAPSVIIAPDY
jgi:hypothetical protein